MEISLRKISHFNDIIILHKFEKEPNYMSCFKFGDLIFIVALDHEYKLREWFIVQISKDGSTKEISFEEIKKTYDAKYMQ